MAHCPTGRFGEPEDLVRLIGWLISDEGRWMVGQVLSSEGGFRRWQRPDEGEATRGQGIRVVDWVAVTFGARVPPPGVGAGAITGF